MRKLLVIAVLLLFAGGLSARDISVSGYVTDKESGEPLLGAGVQYGSGRGCVTNSYGRYTFNIPAGQEVSIVFSYVGYSSRTVELKAQRDTVLDVALLPDAALE